MTDPRTAAVEWLTEALAAELPALAGDELAARAQALVAIAEQYGIPAEDAVKWVQFRAPGKQWSEEEFERWSTKYRDTLRQLSPGEWTRLCPQCTSAHAQRVGERWLCPHCGEIQ